MAIYAWSDIHVDFPANMQRIQQIPDQYGEDYLLLAGDVSDRREQLKQAIGSLVSKFKRVFYVPGNHDLWIHKNDYANSVDKHHALMRFADDLGFSMSPEKVVVGDDSCWIVPLFSWYSGPEDGADSLYLPKVGEDPSLRMWTDKYRVKWPAETEAPNFSAAKFFFDQNVRQMPGVFDAPVVSFSHFLPRAELMVPKHLPSANQIAKIPNDPHPEFNFTRVAGSNLILEQLDSIGSELHVYGHQHRNRWKRVAGRVYVSHCLGYPSEPQFGDSGDKYQPLQVWPLPGDLPDLPNF